MSRATRLASIALCSSLACGDAPDETTDASSEGSSTEVVTTITPDDDGDDDDADDDDGTSTTTDGADTSTGEPPGPDMCERFDELDAALPRTSADEQPALVETFLEEAIASDHGLP